MRPAPLVRTALVAVAAAALLAPPAPAAAQTDPCAAGGGATLPEEVPWQLRRLDPAAVWPLTRGAGTTVAVIDSGVSAAHPMLAGAVRSGRDVGELPDESGGCDLDGHGTLVAGLIAGRQLPGVTVHGVAPGAGILPVRVVAGDRDTPDPDLVAEAITWAVAEGAGVVNLSLTTRPSPALERAVAGAIEAGAVLVAAAGNYDQQGVPSPGYPAGYDGVLAVAGVDAAGGHVASSQVEEYVDVAAPGAEIYGPAPGEGYRFEPAGTSFAAAYVSGVAALVRAYHPELPPAQVVARIVGSADPPPEGRNDFVGAGVVNPYRAVTTLLGNRNDPPAAALPPPVAPADPYPSQTRTAPWLALAGAVLSAALLVTPPILRRGRRRGWRAAGVP